MKLDDYKNYPRISDDEIEPNMEASTCGWYDGPLCGPCSYGKDVFYYHMCDQREPTETEKGWYRRYLIFKMTPEQGNAIAKGEDLDAYEAVGWFEL